MTYKNAARMIFCAAFLFAANAQAQEFHGYPCTQDCSGHEAGYAWAEDHGVADPDDCDGNSNSFVEGCRAFAEEQQQGEFEAQEEQDRDREGRWD
jgi:hypothetical protein